MFYTAAFCTCRPSCFVGLCSEKGHSIKIIVYDNSSSLFFLFFFTFLHSSSFFIFHWGARGMGGGGRGGRGTWPRRHFFLGGGAPNGPRWVSNFLYWHFEFLTLQEGPKSRWMCFLSYCLTATSLPVARPIAITPHRFQMKIYQITSAQYRLTKLLSSRGGGGWLYATGGAATYPTFWILMAPPCLLMH